MVPTASSTSTPSLKSSLLDVKDPYESPDIYVDTFRGRENEGMIPRWKNIMIIDVWSRSIVGWEIHEREDPDLAAALFRSVALRRNVKGVRLHADNGNAMKAATMIMMFFHLGIIPSFSRPRNVST